MRRQISNFVYGLLDYAAYPFGMLALAPLVLRHLGAAQYGVWAVATATVSFGSIVASGFGDANIQQDIARADSRSHSKLGSASHPMSPAQYGGPVFKGDKSGVNFVLEFQCTRRSS